jgi:hypothetical protein
VLIYACVSGHGYGHGSRVASVLLALAARQPQWRLVISTSLPAPFLAGAFGAVTFEQRVCGWDVGTVQANALSVDAAATLMALAELEQRLPAQIEAEAAWLAAQEGPALLLGDVTPAAAQLAEAAGLPLIWMGNFGWDDIYEPMGGEFLAWAERCRGLYRRGQRLIRCPFSLAMDWGLPQTEVGLTAAAPRLDAKQLGRQLDLPPERRRCVLVSFGGMGFPLGPELFGLWPDWCFISSDPASAAAVNGRLLPPGVRPLEVMPLCGRLISKAGYSSFCEALSHGMGIHLVERHGFAEAAVMERELQRHGPHRLLSQAQLLAGDWELDQPLLPARGPALATDGAERAAAAIVAFAASAA